MTEEPSLLLHHGEFLSRTMLRVGVSEAEIYSAMRAEGFDSAEAVDSVILESNGSFSVIPKK